MGKTGSHYLDSDLCSVRKTDMERIIIQMHTTLNCDKCNEEVSPYLVGSYFHGGPVGRQRWAYSVFQVKTQIL